MTVSSFSFAKGKKFKTVEPELAVNELAPVERKAWDEIMKKYGDQPFIKNKVIFAKEDYGHAQGLAKEIDAEVVTGYEQVNPKKLRFSPSSLDGS